MRVLSSIVTVAALSLCLTGCSEDPKERLQGKWEGASVTNVQGPQKIEAVAWAQGVRFEFDKAKMTVAIPSERPRTGNFDIEDADDRELTLRVARAGGEFDIATFTFEDDKLHWDLGNGRAVVLARAD